MTRGPKLDYWMPLYPGDYLADTQHLSAEQHGVYLLLLMAYWKRRGPLPDDDEMLARLGRLSPEAWARHRAVLAEFFQIGDGLWRQNRAEAELQRCMKARLNAQQKGRRGAMARWRDRNPSDGTSNSRGNAPVSPPANAPANGRGNAQAMVTTSLSKERDGAHSGERAATKGSRLPSDWTPTPDLTAYAKGRGWSDHDVSDIAEDFRAYYLSQSGARAIRTDWALTFQTWVRKEDQGRRKKRGAAPAHGGRDAEFV
jgi:uncharacterized protein YdaU (DUF1376 family)